MAFKKARVIEGMAGKEWEVRRLPEEPRHTSNDDDDEALFTKLVSDDDNKAWVQCYDPREDAHYYYCHATKEVTDEPPDDYILADEDQIMSAIIKIQCMGRRRIAGHRVQRVRYMSYRDSHFALDFCSGPCDVLPGGEGIRKQPEVPTGEPVTALAGGRVMYSGKHHFTFHLAKLTANGKPCELGLCPYMKPQQIRGELSGKLLRSIPNSLIVTSRGEVLRSGMSVDAPWMETLGQEDVIGMSLDFDAHKLNISRNAMFLGELSLKGCHVRDLVAAVSIWESGDEVVLQWCDKPPYDEAFSTELEESSQESVEALLNKYKRKRPNKEELEHAAAAAAAPSVSAAPAFDEYDKVAALLRAKSGGMKARAEQVEGVKVLAAAFKVQSEADEKKRKAEEKKKKADQKAALHHIPDSKERKDNERRTRQRYLAKQMERYATARRRFLDSVEAAKREHREYLAGHVARGQEALRVKKEEEEARYSLMAREAKTIFDACRYGMPISRLQELISNEVSAFESRHNSPVKVFNRVCSSVENGYVLESSHPFSHTGIDQNVEVRLDLGTASAAQGVCIVFDPRSDTRAGDGHISFLVEMGQQRSPLRGAGARQSPARHPHLPPSIHQTQSATQNYRGRGLQLNVRATVPENEEYIHENTELPGVNGCPPLFLPSHRFVIRFKTAAFDPPDALGSWGWRLVAFAADSQEHGSMLMEWGFDNANIRHVLDKRSAAGDTALHIAAYEGNMLAVNYLIKAGAAVNAMDSLRTKVTPIHLAAEAGQLPVVKRLLEVGADRMARDVHGDLPLHYACRGGHIRVARKLAKAEGKEAGAVKTRNLKGHLPHEVIPKTTHSLLFEALQDILEGKRRPKKFKRRSNWRMTGRTSQDACL